MIPFGVSRRARIAIEPASRPDCFSASASRASALRISSFDSLLGRQMPLSPLVATACMSGTAYWVVSELMRTKISFPVEASPSIEAATILRAASFSEAGTESSRSSMRASAGSWRAFSNLLSWLPGTNKSVRSISIRTLLTP